MKEYFFAELRRRLSVMGIPSADPVGGWLPILWGGEPVVFVSRSGDVFFEKNHVGQKDMEDLYDMTADLAAEVYVPADFDTIEKALSGAKAAEKGLK